MWTGTVVIYMLRMAGTILLCSLLCVFNSQPRVGKQSTLHPTCNGVHNRIVLQHIQTTFSNTHLYSQHFMRYPKGFPADLRLSYQFPLGSSTQVQATRTKNHDINSTCGKPPSITHPKMGYSSKPWETMINCTPK
jgi:hypothetical protein